MPNPFIKEILDDQSRGIENVRQQCISDFGLESLVEKLTPIYNETTKTLSCPAYWDGIVCWPTTSANTLAQQKCPSYFTGFSESGNATRKCMENGVWYINKSTGFTWTNYTNCFNTSQTVILVDIESSLNVSHMVQEYIPVIKIISQTGYAMSFATLIIAFLIMLLIKKLHCARNILHMHLFASFILRAFIFLLKDLTFIDGVGLAADFADQNGSLYFNINSETNNWNCKLVTSLWHYFITANYSWILMEGLYLHNLIFRALFADAGNKILWYIILGWGLPLPVVLIWSIARILLEDTLCWTTHDDYKIFLIIAIPTMASVLVNFVMFIRISMILYSKLRSPIKDRSRNYKKWAKSTLVLVPLFGVHYALFLGLYYSIRNNKIIELVWLICDRTFGSFQGFFVAILYCFFNGEVKTELKPHIYALLSFLATNKFFKHCFPCREKYLRSVVGRTSICTTMSCSSLCNNGIMAHRNSKCRDPNKKNEFIHVCHPNNKLRSWNNLQVDNRNNGGNFCPSSNTVSQSHQSRHCQSLNYQINATIETPSYHDKDLQLDGNLAEETLKMVQSYP